MKMVRVVGLAGMLVLTSFAFAKLALPNDIFGKVEGALTEGATPQEVAEARASDEYKQGYAAGTDEIEKQPKDEAKKSCSQALESK